MKLDNGTVVTTEGLVGDERYWGVCLDCGFVDELSASSVNRWEQLCRCDACEEAYLRQLGDAIAS